MVNRGVISQSSEVAAARSLGQSMSRLAEWQVSLISTHIIDQLADSADHEPEAIRKIVLRLGAEIIPAVESLQTYVWKRHVRSEEHTSELQSLMRSSYAVLRLKKKQKYNT